MGLDAPPLAPSPPFGVHPVSLDFEWDETKAERNQRKHGVEFHEASSVFRDRFALTVLDSRVPEEDRFVTIGLSSQGRVLVVVYTEREDRLRLISARAATPQERRTYAESP